MKIFLHEITEQEKELTFSETENWLTQAVLRADEHSEEIPAQKTNSTRAIQARFNLRKVDDVIVINGKISTYVQLICSRCATEFQHSSGPGFTALFCKDPVMAGVGYLQRQTNDPHETQRPGGQTRGHARHAHDSESEGKDLDITYLSHDFIDLGDVITEQLQLQIPFQPLCKETCKGICSRCGADLNQGRCACAQIEKRRPFSVLSDFKI